MTPSRGLKCSVGRKVRTECGLSSRYPAVKDCIPIQACNRDLQVYLRNLNLSKTAVQSEGELILLRTGVFDPSCGDNMTVCPRHRETLGLSWRSSRKCAHPLHGARKSSNDRAVTIQISKEILDIWNTFVPFGSCKSMHFFSFF